MTATLPGCAAEPIHIVLGSESHTMECGCGWRTPLVADARTARQAMDTHRRLWADTVTAFNGEGL